MKKSTILVIALFALTAIFFTIGCDPRAKSADKIQSERQETLAKEGAAEVGLPAITNFFEMRCLKNIYELRDQKGYMTYTYLENMIPTVVHGKTALGGKLTFFCRSIGYGIPVATQYTSPMRPAKANETYEAGNVTVPQADPNGLFSPSSAEGTWVLIQNPNNPEQVLPFYCEPRVIVSPFELPLD